MPWIWDGCDWYYDQDSGGLGASQFAIIVLKAVDWKLNIFAKKKKIYLVFDSGRKIFSAVKKVVLAFKLDLKLNIFAKNIWLVWSSGIKYSINW